MIIIPAIDLLDGKCVRLRAGRYETAEVFSGDPRGQAAKFIAAGARRLHVVDLDGARVGTPQNLSPLKGIIAEAAGSGVAVQFGGGLRSHSTLEELFALGIDFAILGTKAVTEPEFLQAASVRFPKNIILALDVLAGGLAVNGWKKSASITMAEFYHHLPNVALAGLIYTDISRDGSLRGMNTSQLTAAALTAPCPVIASGGFSTLADARAIEKIKNFNRTGCWARGL